MFGLVIAAMIFVVTLFNTSDDVTVLVPIAATFPFLWYWHWVWTGIKAVFAGTLAMLGLAGLIRGKETVIQGGGLALFALSPLIFIAISITSALFLTAVYCMDRGLTAGGDMVSQKYFVTGCALYGIGILVQLTTKSNTSNHN